MITSLLALISLALILRWLWHHKPPDTHPNQATASPEYDMSKRSKEDELRDIYHIAFLLRQKLVPDVIPAILHHAGLFQRHTYNFKPANPLLISERQAPHTCLATPRIQSSARVQFPVRKVVFAISSSDQGWVNNPDAGSWTWFTASVLRSEGRDVADMMAGVNVRDEDGNDRFLDRERQILRNDVATREFKLHIVEWTIDSEDESERAWVAGLQNGDRIAVRAWAQFNMWVNKVRSVTVCIYTAAVV